MALPHILKHIYTNGTDEVIRRGKKIHALGFVELIEFDKLTDNIVFRVKDDTYSNFCKVYIQKYSDPRHISLRCSCPYNLGEICKHEVAALLQLQEMLDKGQVGNEDVYYDQRHTVVKLRNLDLRSLRTLCSTESFSNAETFLQKKKAKIISARDETVKATLTVNGTEYTVVIRKNAERNFDTSCDYEDTDYPLCLPKVIVLMQLIKQHGADYFDTIRNRDVEKNKLLEAYGYSLADDLKGKFEFVFKDGKPFLRVLDARIKRVHTPGALVSKPATPQPVQEVSAEADIAVETAPLVSTRLGFVFNFNKHTYPYFAIDAIIGEANEEQAGFAGKVELIDVGKYIDTDNYNEKDVALLNNIRKLQDAELKKYIVRNMPFADALEDATLGTELTAEQQDLAKEYMLPRIKKLLSDASESSLGFILPAGKKFITQNLENVDVMETPASIEFFIDRNGENFSCECLVQPMGGTGRRLEGRKKETSGYFSTHFVARQQPCFHSSSSTGKPPPS